MAGRRDGAVATRRLPLRVSRLPTPYFRIRGSHRPNQASGRLVAFSAGLFDFNGFLPNVYTLTVFIGLIIYWDQIMVVCVFFG